MERGHIKRVFPGCNTSLGFYSFYDYIAPPDATRIFVIKGGPGVGKSTFIRGIGEALVARGMDVEFHHCSSDNSSLDGLYIPAIKVAIIDGTAPHVVDPRWPGAVDEIIHLGEYWDENGLRARRKEIMAAGAEAGRCFARAYRFLKAAQVVYDDWETLNRQAMDYALANQKAATLLDEILNARPVSSRLGRERHLFASAITPDGLMNYVETIIGPVPRKYVIEGEPGTGKSHLLKKVATAALERGLDAELYHCPLNPEKVEHVVIPALGIALTKSIEPHTWRPAAEDIVVDMNECLNPAAVERNRAAMADCERLFGQLFSQAIACIHDAKASHDLMEAYYVPCMDFEKITEVRERTLQRILGYAAEVGIAAE